MDEYERRKRDSHEVVGRCAYSDCDIDNHQIRAGIDFAVFWGKNRVVHAKCDALWTEARQRSGGTVVQSRETA